MKLIAGLGNIGDKYCFTRHNAGFMVLDKWAYIENFSFKQDSKLKAFVSRCKIGVEDVLFVKPTTFMNLSGETLGALKSFYKIDINTLFVVYDDISLDLGKIRFRPKGSDGGHNGIKSIDTAIGPNYKRIRIGIGHPRDFDSPIPPVDWVLGKFNAEQLEKIQSVIKSINF